MPDAISTYRLDERPSYDTGAPVAPQGLQEFALLSYGLRNIPHVGDPQPRTPGRARHRREEAKRKSWREAKSLSWRGVQNLAIRVLTNGGERQDVHHVRGKFAGDCVDPLEWTYAASPISKTETREHKRKRQHLQDSFMSVTIERRCDRCEPCLDARRKYWAARAISECKGSCETLFLTLTFKPELQFRYLTECRAVCAEEGRDFDALSVETQFALRVSKAGPEVGKYIKRIRKSSPAPIGLGGKPLPNWRYLLIAEAHQAEGSTDTRPHFHMLLHCVWPGFEQKSSRLFVPSLGKEVDTWPFLEEQWSALGYATIRRVTDSKSAAYICKYLSKDSRTRVRASRDPEYGSMSYPDYAQFTHSSIVETTEVRS